MAFPQGTLLLLRKYYWRPLSAIYRHLTWRDNLAKLVWMVFFFGLNDASEGTQQCVGRVDEYLALAIG